MWHEERRQRLRALLTRQGFASVDEVARAFGVSRESIRRDLVDMEAAGELRRVRGGAVALDAEREALFGQRTHVRVKEKRMIAAAAARLVVPGQTVFLDAGSTTSILAERLALLPELTVITNSIDAATRIVQAEAAHAHGNRVILVGGDFAAEPPATSGSSSINEMRRYRADWAMLSPYGLDLDRGATSYDPAEAEVARAMIASAAATAILADHSKLGLVGRVSYCDLTGGAQVIVDQGAKRTSFVQFADARGIRVLVAGRNGSIIAE